MKSCWKILGIEPTTNTQAIKKAYRELVKKYHPDRARSPEKVRHFTIKCAEIIEAYRQAVQESAKVGMADSISAVNNAHRPARAARRTRASWLGFVFCMVFVVIGLGIWGEVLFDLSVGPLNLATVLLKWFSSLRLDSPVRETVSGIIAIPLGVLIGGVLAMFGPMLLSVFAVAYLENTRFSGYSYKIAWLLLMIAQYFAVYHFGFHWPFEHRATAYYAALYQISRVAGWLYLPLAGLWFWTAEYYRYVRVKRRTDILPVAV